MIVDLVIRMDGGQCDATVVGIRAETEPGPAGS